MKEKKKQTLSHLFSSFSLSQRDWSCRIKTASVLFQVSHALFGKVGNLRSKDKHRLPGEDGYSCLNTARGKMNLSTSKTTTRNTFIGSSGKVNSSPAPWGYFCLARPSAGCTRQTSHCKRNEGNIMSNCMFLFTEITGAQPEQANVSPNVWNRILDELHTSFFKPLFLLIAPLLCWGRE